jgi:hypothetical protein
VSVSASAIHAKPHGDLLAVREQHVRRLHVTVEDAGRVRVRQAVADLRARLDRGAVVELAGAQGLPECASRHEFVGDVDVPRVTGERVGAQAARMAQAGRCGRLALGAGGGLALSGDDLEGDVEARLLVACEPDRSRAAAAEGTERAVPVEDEPAPLERECSVRHGSRQVGGRRVISSLGERRSTVWPDWTTV